MNFKKILSVYIFNSFHKIMKNCIFYCSFVVLLLWEVMLLWQNSPAFCRWHTFDMIQREAVFYFTNSLAFNVKSVE